VLGALAQYATGAVLDRERLHRLVDRLPLVEIADLDGQSFGVLTAGLLARWLWA